MEDAIHGLTMKDCAEIMSKDGELKAQYGERDYKPHLDQYLAGRSVDQNTWAQAWNGWWERMEADPSGQLHAKFSMMQQELTMKAHMADVPDASQDAKEGVTLDVYAQIMAKIAGGEDADAVLGAQGIPMDQWQRAQEAWNAAMAADTDHHLTTQYGMLYAKYTPGFQQQMQDQTAAIMAQRHAERAEGVDDEPEVEYTFEDAVAELDSPKPNTRWTAAHHVANFWDIGDRDEDPRLNDAAKKTIPLMIDCLEHHDEFTASDAESLARDLCTFASEGFLGAQADDAKHAMEMCLGRAQEKLATLKAAFAPIADKAVPERVRMQASIQDYTSLTEELEEMVSEWDENLGEAPAPSASSASSGGAALATSGGGGGGFLDVLKRLPVIGAILRMLGL